MSPASASAANQHSRLCVRRMSSRATLRPNNHHSRVCVRNKYQSLKSRVQSIVRSTPVCNTNNSLRLSDYFIGNLPLELRHAIYKYLLNFEVPIHQARSPRRKEELLAVAILFVNRQIYSEALPLLYELNTVVSRRLELCQVPGARPPTWNTKLIRRLYICDLEPSSKCANKLTTIWPSTNRPCAHCKPSLLELIHTLCHMPGLKDVFIDYHRFDISVQTLAQELERSDDLKSQLQLVCVGIGMYRLQGQLGGVSIQLHNVPLSEVWLEIVALPTTENLIPYLQASRVMWKNMKGLEAKFGPKTIRRMVARLLILVSLQDSQTMPHWLSSRWPPGTPRDIRKVNDIADPRFLHELNMLLQYFLDAPLF